MKKKYRIPTGPEQEILDGLNVRLVLPEELEKYNHLIETEHYLHSSAVVGETLRYVAEYDDQWVGLLTWMACAYHIKSRDEWIGWTPEQRSRRRPFVVNNSRFLLIGDHHYPNAASRCLKLCLDRLSTDWQEKYDHRVLVAETFVDPQFFCGTTYKASNWELLGQTQGNGRVSREYYEFHDRPKQLWVKELDNRGCDLLRSDPAPDWLKAGELDITVTCQTQAEELCTIRKLFEGVTEHRKGRIYYPAAGLLTLIFCAVLSGVSSGQRDLAAYAANLTQPQLRALGFRKRDRQTRKRLAPKETTFFRLLSTVEPCELERILLGCLNKLLGAHDAEDKLIVIDGKALRSSDGKQVVSAFSVLSGRWMGSEMIEEKSNEIPAGRKLINKLPIENAMILTDALHTQFENAQKTVVEYGADYFMTVKGNQKTLKQTLGQIVENGQENSFFPS